MSANDLSLDDLGLDEDDSGDLDGSEQELGAERLSARVGPIEFKNKFDDPIVDLVQKYRTAEHEVVTGATGEDEFVVQHLGRSPPEITVNGVITEGQLDSVQEFDEGYPIYLRSNEWTGTAIPKRVTQKPRREKRDGEWLYDITIKLTGKERGVRPSFDAPYADGTSDVQVFPSGDTD